MKKIHHLTPGPSELYFTVPDHIKNAINNNVASMSHRSKDFEVLYERTVNALRRLLNVPENYHVVFTNSATEIWERLIQNCVEKQSYHLVNGSFSKRFFEFSEMLGKKAEKYEAPFGEGFNVEEINVSDGTEMLCITQNETSSGVSFPVEDIYYLREKYPDLIIAVDAVSAVPYLDIDFNKIDSLFFSVQKGMGLPAGLGVWIFNNKCVKKANKLSNEGKIIGTYHSIPAILDKAVKNQTPATPNVLGIDVLGKVCEDMIQKGIDNIRQETNYKAAFAYNLFEQHQDYEVFVKNEKHRSQTVIVAELKKRLPSELIQYLEEKGIAIGTGYGKYKSNQIRIANFPTHSKEIFLYLIDLIEQF